MFDDETHSGRGGPVRPSDGQSSKSRRGCIGEPALLLMKTRFSRVVAGAAVYKSKRGERVLLRVVLYKGVRARDVVVRGGEMLHFAVTTVFFFFFFAESRIPGVVRRGGFESAEDNAALGELNFSVWIKRASCWSFSGLSFGEIISGFWIVASDLAFLFSIIGRG